VADSFWTAKKARDLLEIKWTNSSRVKGYSSDDELERFVEISSNPDGAAVIFEKGNSATDGGKPVKTLRATYSSAHVHHATMEPPSATALVEGGRVQIWGLFKLRHSYSEQSQLN